MGPGMGRVAGRGISNVTGGAAQPGLSGPVHGVGGPAPSSMQPQHCLYSLNDKYVTYSYTRAMT